MHLSIILFFFSSFLVLFFNPTQPMLLSSSSNRKLFELHSLPPGCLTFLGDSHLQYGTNAKNTIALTKEGMPTDAPRSTGMVIYSRPILFLDPNWRKVRSFSTTFAFSIKNMYGDGKDSSDGLAFLISPNDDLLNGPGYLGLADSKGLTRNKFIAIEFDTKYDPMYQDPDNNHLGLDINSLLSVQLVTSHVDLKSGNVISTWIDYKSDEKRLEVFLNDIDLKPVKPLLKVDIDLSNYLKEEMFVGFSAATDGSMTSIERWEFTIVEFIPPPPLPPTLSPLESGRTFPIPYGSGDRHSHLSRLAIGHSVGACSIPFIAAFVWFCCKKMIQKLEGTNNLEMQTMKSSEGRQEIRLSVINTNPNEVARDLIIEKVVDNETELIRVKTVNFSIPYSTTFINR